jgi:hypothetical protein
MVNIGAAAGTPMDDKDYRDPIQVPPISTASSPVIQVVRHIHDSTLAVLGEWGGQVKMLSVEINHFPFQACRLVGHTPAKQPTVIMGTRTAEKRLETV